MIRTLIFAMFCVAAFPAAAEDPRDNPKFQAYQERLRLRKEEAKQLRHQQLTRRTRVNPRVRSNRVPTAAEIRLTLLRNCPINSGCKAAAETARFNEAFQIRELERQTHASR